jgi:hypothetical protein
MTDSLRDELAASCDPTRGRRLLDAMECGAVGRGGRSRRIVARLNLPGTVSFREWLRRHGLEGMEHQNESSFGRNV